MDAVRQNVGQRLADSEKITINLGFVDLGHIDLLYQPSLTLTHLGREFPLDSVCDSVCASGN